MITLRPLVLVAMLAFVLAAGPATTQRSFEASGPFTSGIAYKHVGEQTLFMLTHFPGGWAKSDRRACVVLFFGGGWTSRWSSLYDDYAEHLADEGLVVLRPDYRLGAIESCVQDAKSAVRYAREHAAELGVDPQRIIASGGSSGGHLAVAAAVLPGFDDQDAPEDASRPNAVIALCPVLDLTPEDSTTGKQIGPERAKALSPIAHLGERKPVPTVIIVAANDSLAEQCQAYAEKAKSLAQPVDLKILPQGGHNFFNSEPGRGMLYQWTAEFLKRNKLWETN